MEGITQNYTLETILEKYPESLTYASEELAKVINKLTAFDLRITLREKYVFNFMTSFIRKQIEEGGDAKRRTIVATTLFLMSGMVISWVNGSKQTTDEILKSVFASLLAGLAS